MLNESKDRAKPFERGQEQAEAMLAMQKELLETCDQASRAWLDRVKSKWICGPSWLPSYRRPAPFRTRLVPISNV